MRISQIMTRDPLAVDSDESIVDALIRMDDLNIRHLPVVEGGRVVGILSDRNLLEATGWLPGDGARLQAFVSDDHQRSVAEIMHKRPVTAHPDDQIVSLSQDLLLRGIGSLPVLGEQQELIGIVTDTDMIRAFERAISDGSLGASEDPPIADYMAESVVTANPDTSYKEAVELCRTHWIRHLPIVESPESTELIGLVSDRDLRWGKGRELPEDAPISSLMTTALKTLPPDALCSHAARLFTEFKISSIPVVEGKQLISIITTTDLLEHCGHTLWQLADTESH